MNKLRTHLALGYLVVLVAGSARGDGEDYATWVALNVPPEALAALPDGLGFSGIDRGQGWELHSWDSAVLGPPPEAEALPDPTEHAAALVEFRNTVQQLRRNLAKPLEQKLAENAFFALTEAVLTAVGDERAGQSPPVRLGFLELNASIKSLQTTDPTAAIVFALDLLAIDASLKRFDPLWWDTATQHAIPEE